MCDQQDQDDQSKPDPFFKCLGSSLNGVLQFTDLRIDMIGRVTVILGPFAVNSPGTLLVQGNANNAADRRQSGMLMGNFNNLQRGMYAGALAPLEAAVADTKLSHAQRLDAVAESAHWIATVQENVAHVSHVSLMFTMTMAYIVVKDLKVQRKLEYKAKYQKMPPWDVVCVTLFPGKIEVLGIRLDGKRCTFHRVCTTLTNQTPPLRKLSFEALCQLDHFTLAGAETAVHEVAKTQGVARVSVRSRAMLIGGGAADTVLPRGGGKCSALPPPPPPPRESLMCVYIQRQRD
jgi:hypothetical protein